MTTDPVTAEELLFRAYADAFGLSADDPALEVARNVGQRMARDPQLREAIEFGLLKPLYVAVMEAAQIVVDEHDELDTGHNCQHEPRLRDALEALTTAPEAREQDG